jgi:hypothetical protein
LACFIASASRFLLGLFLEDDFIPIIAEILAALALVGITRLLVFVARQERGYGRAILDIF